MHLLASEMHTYFAALSIKTAAGLTRRQKETGDGMSIPRRLSLKPSQNVYLRPNSISRRPIL